MFKTSSAILAVFVLSGSSFAAESSSNVSVAQGWTAVPGTDFQSICAGENGFPSVLGNSGCAAVTSGWSGGIFDTKRNRMIVFGGGHNDYFGNELYAFNVNSQTIERLTDPGLPTASGCQEGIANNTQPNSRHTYDGIEYIASADKMFVFGGSLACAAGNFGSDTWTFDFGQNRWQRMNPSGTLPNGDAGMLTAYDPVTGLLFLHDRQYLYSYDVAADRYTRLSSSSAGIGYTMAATIDVANRLFVIAGHDSVQGGGRVYTYDIGAGSNYSKRTLSTSGGGAVVNTSYPGLAYDTDTQKVVAWSASAGNSVYSLNSSSGQWSAMTFSGSPTPVQNGTHSRWRYSPDSGVFVLVNKMSDNVYLFKSSDAAVAKPNPPSLMSISD